MQLATRFASPLRPLHNDLQRQASRPLLLFPHYSSCITRCSCDRWRIDAGPVSTAYGTPPATAGTPTGGGGGGVRSGVSFAAPGTPTGLGRSMSAVGPGVLMAVSQSGLSAAAGLRGASVVAAGALPEQDRWGGGGQHGGAREAGAHGFGMLL